MEPFLSHSDCHFSKHLEFKYNKTNLNNAWIKYLTIWRISFVCFDSKCSRRSKRDFEKYFYQRRKKNKNLRRKFEVKNPKWLDSNALEIIDKILEFSKEN